MFLIILEDLSIRKTEKVTEEDLGHCNDGYIDVVNLNTDKPMQYFKGEWHEVPDI